MKTAYIDCFSGISGDMMVGALIDLGLPLDHLENELCKIPVDGYSIGGERVSKSGVESVDFKVRVKGRQRSRDYRDIRNIIAGSSLKEEVKMTARGIFDILAVAEGKVHGVAPEDVHFHELGGVDSIVDIVGTAIGVDYLNMRDIYASRVATGTGMIKGDHGLMPVPAPATAEILKGIPLSAAAVEGEMVTPTGAAILKMLVKDFGPMPDMTVECIGYGAGDRDFGEHPNLLRLFMGRENKGKDFPYERDRVVVMEASIDDMNPQFFEPLVEALFAAGCFDVTMTPLYMKKGRPGTLLQVLTPDALKEKAADLIFGGSTTIGIRCFDAERIKLRRSEENVKTPLGDIKVKVIEKGGGIIEVRPEYDELKRLALQEGISVVEVTARVSGYLSKPGRQEGS